eukprot:11530329-Karenia_brevis.AAC.1
MPDSNTLTIFCVGLSNISAATCLTCAAMPVLLPVGDLALADAALCPAFLIAAAWAGMLGTGPHITLPVADSKAPST